MAIQILRASNDDSIQFDEIDDAFRVERDGMLTNFRAQDVDIARDLVLEDTRSVAQNLEALLYESGPAHGEGFFVFDGATTIPDGRVVFAPFNSSNIGIYDPETNAYTSGDTHNEGAGGLFQGATTIPDGRVIFAPRNSANIGIYDPDTDTYTSGPAHGEGSTAFNGATALDDGRVVFAPLSSDNVGIYDPDTDTYTNSFANGDFGFEGATTLQDGRVVFAPNDNDNVGIFDPETNTYTSGPAHGEGSFAFSGATTLDDGRVIFAPFSSNNIGIFDPSSDSYTSGPAHGEGDSAFSGITTLQDGRIIFVPFNSNNVGVFDPDTDTYTSGPAHEEGTSAFRGGTILQDGRAVFAPNGSDNIGIVSLQRSQFLLRNPETGITEGVDYDNLEQFINTDEITVNPGSINAAGSDRDVQINGSSTLSSATGNNTFSFTSSGELLAGTGLEESGGTVVGNYNLSSTPDGTSIFQIGNGTNDANRSNAMTVYEDGLAQFSNRVESETEFAVDGNNAAAILKIRDGLAGFPRAGFQLLSDVNATNYGFRISTDRSPSDPRPYFMEVVNADSTPENGDHNRIALTARSHPDISSITSLSGIGSTSGSSIAFGTEDFSSNYTLFLERQTKNVGIDTDVPVAKLDVNGDMIASESITTETEFRSTSATGGVILTAPDGTEYRVTVDNNGTIKSTIV